MTGDPKPPHVTQLFKAGDLWGWGCTCRASDGTHETRSCQFRHDDSLCAPCERLAAVRELVDLGEKP